MSNELKLQKLYKQFGDTVAVDGINLEARSGELLAVVGPSGCGKTTLLRMIAGLERPDKGEIWLGETPLFNAGRLVFVPPHQRRIGMVFQNYALWPHMNVFQNVAYPLRVQRIGRKQQQKAVDRALAQVCMTGFDSRYPHQLSGGEQQRVALARALVMQPRILLLDEPLSNLDAHLREEMGGEIRRIQLETGLTVIHVTHDQVEAMTLADHIVVMEKGRVVQIGRPREIYCRPKNCFVANFMGSSNLLNCVLGRHNGHHEARFPDGSTMVVEQIQGAGSGDVTLSVRPEDIILSSDGYGSAAKIMEISYQGNLVRYRLLSGEVELKVQAQPGVEFQTGDEVRLHIQHATVIPEDGSGLNWARKKRGRLKDKCFR